MLLTLTPEQMLREMEVNVGLSVLESYTDVENMWKVPKAFQPRFWYC